VGCGVRVGEGKFRVWHIIRFGLNVLLGFLDILVSSVNRDQELK
jgi:hypothetical protein